MSSSGEGLFVRTDRDSLRADAVVVAGGSWSARIGIDDAAPPPVRPVRGQLLRLAWDGPRLGRVTWGERCYLVPWDDGTVLVGATVEDAGFDERTTVGMVRLFAREASTSIGGILEETRKRPKRVGALAAPLTAEEMRRAGDHRSA